MELDLASRTKRLASHTHRVEILAGETPLARWDFWSRLGTDEALRTVLTDALRRTPFQAFFWETVPLSRERMESPFEFVVVDAPTLAYAKPDPAAFADQFSCAAEPFGRAADFSTATASVVSFPNLAGDSVLVVPCPTSASYGHLATFLRQAPAEQTDALWRTLGVQVAAWVETSRPMPLWVSTSGLAVPWLHVRVDARPKYYGHRPYTRPDA
jgi:hypothetical protein